MTTNNSSENNASQNKATLIDKLYDFSFWLLKGMLIFVWERLKDWTLFLRDWNEFKKVARIILSSVEIVTYGAGIILFLFLGFYKTVYQMALDVARNICLYLELLGNYVWNFICTYLPYIWMVVTISGLIWAARKYRKVVLGEGINESNPEAKHKWSRLVSRTLLKIILPFRDFFRYVLKNTVLFPWRLVKKIWFILTRIEELKRFLQQSGKGIACVVLIAVIIVIIFLGFYRKVKDIASRIFRRIWDCISAIVLQFWNFFCENFSWIWLCIATMALIWAIIKYVDSQSKTEENAEVVE